MKKTLTLVLVALFLVSGLFVLTGCGNNGDNRDNGNAGKGYNKEVESYSVKTYDETGSVEFEFEKADKYTANTSSFTLTIKNSENYAEVKVSALHDYIASSTITKKEKDFYDEKYHDYKEVTEGDHTGWEIYKGESEYKTTLVLSEKDSDGKVYAAEIQVVKSPVMKDNMTFDVAEFVKGEDFQHLLDTIKATVNSTNE